MEAPSSIDCVKSVRIRSFSGLYFPAFGPNTEIYKVLSKIYEVLCLFISVFSPNAGKCGPEKFRIRTLFTKLLFESSYYRLVCNTCFNPLSANHTKWSNISNHFVELAHEGLSDVHILQIDTVPKNHCPAMTWSQNLWSVPEWIVHMWSKQEEFVLQLCSQELDRHGVNWSESKHH